MDFRFVHRYFPVGIAAVIAAITTGCASVAVTEDALQQRTAFALSLEKNDFTISDRADNGVTTHYKVTTKAGKKYNCYVEGSVSVVGRVVSDAICRDAAGAANASPNSGAPNPSCNELLKAAGQC